MIPGNCVKAFQYKSENLLTETIKKNAFTN